ncbi:MAG TPA: hypothetical protein VFJ89_06230 [Nocardioides sp.]|jgi:hypothetical protein|nr:hypothetical protein [Nocardioides sp.]
MGAFLVPVILVVIALVALVLVMKRFTRAEVAHSDRLQASHRPSVRYEVPPGQDPALVLAGLRSAGYDASADSEPGPSSPIVIIATSGSAADRERLREVLAGIAGTNVNPEESAPVERGRVRFIDEA